MKDVSARVDALAEKMALTAQVLKDVSVLSEKITNLLIEQGGSRTERGAVLAHIHDLRESDKALQVMVHAMQRDLDRLMGKSGQ